MKERPILFSAPMVRAILGGTKTQTRRVVKLRNGQYMPPSQRQDPNGWAQMIRLCPHGKPGDRLWVRETCRAEELIDGMDGVRYLADSGFIALRPGLGAVDRWLDLRDYGKRPSPGARIKTVPAIHMPRWASRITLEITGVRVERLQDISEADAVAEGIEHDQDISRGNIIGWRDYLSRGGKCGTAPGSYRSLWESINGPGSWDANPWVWVVEFKRLEGGSQ